MHAGGTHSGAPTSSTSANALRTRTPCVGLTGGERLRERCRALCAARNPCEDEGDPGGGSTSLT
eukprot:1616990-Prymnesium_polylepis.1